MSDRDRRMHELLYSNEGRVEQCERIYDLEQLVRDMWFGNLHRMNDPCTHCRMGCDASADCDFWVRIKKLGIKEG